MVAAAKAECRRVSIIKGKATSADLTSLLAVCAPALSSLEVSAALCTAVASLCADSNGKPAHNSKTCGAAGVIPAVVDILSAHGHSNRNVCWNGCRVLCLLSFRNRVNADAVVLSHSRSGLDVILSVMVSHAQDGDVQEITCSALKHIARAASPAALRALRESAATELVRAAKRNHAGDDMLRYEAHEALAVLEG